MYILYFINLFLCLFIEYYKYRFTSKYFSFNLISPVSISFILNYPLFLFINIIGPLSLGVSILNKYYQFAILMINLSNILSLIAVIVITKNRNKIFEYFNPVLSLFSFPINVHFKGKVKYMIIFFLFMYLTSFFLLTNHSIGIFSWITNPRLGYQLYREGAGQWFALTVTSLSVLSFLTLIFLEKKYLIFLVPLIAFLWYLTGSKGFVLKYFEFTLLILFTKLPYNNFKKIFPLFLGLSLLPVLYLFFGSGFNLSLLLDQFGEITSYFDHMVNAINYYEAYFNNQITLFYGEIFKTSFWSLVPRNIYPQKPYAYGPVLISEIFYPGQAELTNTPAFGGMVTDFADFGIFGVIVGSIFNFTFFFQTLVFSKFYEITKSGNFLNNKNYLGLFLLFVSPSFLFFLAFPLNMILFIIIFLIIYFISKFTLIKKSSLNI